MKYYFIIQFFLTKQGMLTIILIYNIKMKCFVDIDECQNIDICMHNGTCINNNGSYVCECIAGWQGHHCEDGNFTVRFCGSTKLFLHFYC